MIRLITILFVLSLLKTEFLNAQVLLEFYTLHKKAHYLIYHSEKQINDSGEIRICKDSLLNQRYKVLIDSIIKDCKIIDTNTVFNLDLRMLIKADNKRVLLNGKNDLVIVMNAAYYYTKLTSDSCIIKPFRIYIPAGLGWYIPNEMDYENEKYWFDGSIENDWKNKQLQNKQIEEYYKRYRIDKKNRKKIDKVIVVRKMPFDQIEEFIKNYKSNNGDR